MKLNPPVLPAPSLLATVAEGAAIYLCSASMNEISLKKVGEALGAGGGLAQIYASTDVWRKNKEEARKKEREKQLAEAEKASAGSAEG